MENTHLEEAKREVGTASGALLTVNEHVQLAQAQALIAIAEELHRMNELIYSEMPRAKRPE